MLRILYSSIIALFFMACTPSSSIILSQAEEAKTLDSSTIFKITIPVKEHGYSHFNTLVITSQAEFLTFITSVHKQKNWNKKDNFIDSLTLNAIDFKTYNLLLYRMTESSGSTVLAIEKPTGNNKHILIKIGRDKPSIGTSDMAYYALAYKVKKSIQDITFDNGIKKHVIKNKILNN